MARAVVKGVVVALPVAIVALTAVMTWVEGNLADGFATAALPAILIGVFFGGFVGVARTMD
jgi:hypothetical protein